MYWREFPSSVDAPRPDSSQLWLFAGLSFGLGDVATTVVGLRLTGVYELNLIATNLFQYSTIGALIVLKGVVLGICYVLWKGIPRPHRVGVPLGLLFVGTLVTIWNLHVLLRAMVP